MSEKLPSSYEQAIGTFNASDTKPRASCGIRHTYKGHVFCCIKGVGHSDDHSPSFVAYMRHLRRRRCDAQACPEPSIFPRFRLWRYGRRQKK